MSQPPSTAGDWKLTTIGWVFSVAMAVLGLSAFAFARWVEDAGPRKAMFAAACCFGGGFLVAALGVHLHEIWIIYLGYGVLGGIGLGVGYVSPVATLMKWFPDRPGMATGLAIMGFGGGAMVGSPLAAALMDYFKSATSVGVVETFAAMGLIYFAFMMFGVLTVRVPADGWKPASYTSAPAVAPIADQAVAPQVGTRAGRSDHERRKQAKDVHMDVALRTPQFWLLWAALCINATAGIGILGQASPMIQETFPNNISPRDAAGFVGLLGLANMFGRIAWASSSDLMGRKRAFTIYFALGAALYALAPSTGPTGNVMLFVASYVVIISMFGGGFATIPAYLRDTFGDMHVGAIHARILTAWTLAGIAGPVLVNYIREYELARGVAKADAYTATMYLMAGLLAVGFVANALVRPVNPRHHFVPDTGVRNA